MPRQKVKGFQSNGIIIVSDARIDDLIRKVAHELLTSPSGRNNFGNWGVQESQVSILWNCGLWAHHVG